MKTSFKALTNLGFAVKKDCDNESVAILESRPDGGFNHDHPRQLQ